MNLSLVNLGHLSHLPVCLVIWWYLHYPIFSLYLITSIQLKKMRESIKPVCHNTYTDIQKMHIFFFPISYLTRNFTLRESKSLNVEIFPSPDKPGPISNPTTFTSTKSATAPPGPDELFSVVDVPLSFSPPEFPGDVVVAVEEEEDEDPPLPPPPPPPWLLLLPRYV